MSGLKESQKPIMASICETSLRKSTSPELHLRRLTGDEALYRLEQYLDAAFMDNYTWVRIVHGKGSGKIREVVWAQLAKSSLVKNFQLAPYGQGDAGVTIVQLYQRSQINLPK